MRTTLLRQQCGAFLGLIQVLCVCLSDGIQVTSFVNESASFTITFPSQQQSVTLWQLNNGINNSIVQCSGSPCSCSATEILNKTSLYNITCGTTYVTVTINHVQLEQHNDVWKSTLVGSNITYVGHVYVNVRVSNVSFAANTTLGEDVTNKLTLNETNMVKFVCNSSFCRPNATVNLRFSKAAQQDINILPNNVSYTNNSDFWQTSAIFELRLNRSMTDWNISCIATNNQEINVTSRSFDLNIQYPPDRPPTIPDFSNGSVYTIIENNQAHLMCSVDKSNPEAKLNWTCENRGKNITEISNSTSSTIYWTASRNSNSMCTCLSDHILSGQRISLVSVNVLYPPEYLNVNLMSKNFSALSIPKNITIAENTNLTFNCSAQGNPLPDNYSWFGNGTSDTAILHIRTERRRDLSLTCLARNYMNESKNGKTTGQNNETYFLEVLYPPEIESLNRSYVIEGYNFNKTCTILFGKTSGHFIAWKGFSNTTGKDSSLLYFPVVNRNQAGNYTCEVNYSLFPTYGENKTGLIRNEFYLDVLFSAENVEVTLTLDDIEVNTIDNQISLIENATTLLRLNCSAHGNPIPNNYEWTGRQQNHSSIIQLQANRNITGNYTCNATNTMTPTKGGEVIGHTNRTYELHILYPPEITQQSNLTVVEGEDFQINCVLPGKISYQSIVWFGNHIYSATNTTVSVNLSTDNNTLRIDNITKEQAGNLTCTVKYTMVPTYGENVSSEISQYTIVDILYKPRISSFFVGKSDQNVNVTVNESSHVRMVCIVDSNPISTMNISIRNSTLSHKENTKTLEYNISKSNCSNTGIYVCSGHNVLKTQPASSSKDLRLFVNCKPRRSLTAELQQNVTLSLHGAAKFTFGALAYPLPQFNWYRYIASQLINATNGTNKIINISENEVRLEFTLIRVNEFDFGEYVLTLNNTFGGYQQSFFLLRADSTSAAPNTEEGSITGPLVGGIVGSVLCIAAIVAAMFIVRKRRLGKMSQEDKQYHEYQNMNFMKDDKQQKRLPPLPSEDSNDIQDRQKHQVEDSHPDKNTTEFKMQQKSKEIKQHPEYENMALTEDAKQNKRFHLDLIENDPHTHQYHKGGDSEDNPDPKTSQFKMQQKPTEVKQHPEYENLNLTEDAKHRKRLPPIPPDDAYEVPDQQNQAHHVKYAEDYPYPKTLDLLEIINKISLSDLFSYVTSKTKEDYVHEYTRFSLGMMDSISYSFARKPQNAPLNRYQGIYPYDHSRVVIPAEPDFFINANYIDGHSKEKAYIASLGPTVRHTLGFQTFWKMVWHEKSDVIVMLTNLQEPSGMKCEKYWADHGTTREVGDFTIQSVTEEVAGEYIVRTFNVTKKGESRSVTQLHYTAWPDKKVPEDVTSLIEFWQRVKAAPTRSLGPLVVHCSAGIGRTGTYIAIDRLFEEGKSTNTVNVFDCVMNMRKQRVNMVQTQDQYVYLHQALVYCLVFNIEPITADKIEEYVKTTSHNVYSKLFQQLKQSVEVESTYETEARTRNCDVLERNRQKADIPGDAHRVRLFLDKESDESDYINAVYLNDFKRLGHFIIAQSPLPNTLDDFVCMLYQENCCCVVSLDDYQQKGTNNAEYLPPENQQVTFGNFTISSTMLDDTKPAYSVRKLKIGHSGRFEKGVKIAHHFEFTGWKHDEKIPKDAYMFVDFVKDVQEYAAQLADEHSHVLVHCMTGSGRSGLFCAVSNLIQKMGQERQVSVVNTLRQVRARRQTAIPNMEQIKFCYQSVYAFVKNYKI